LGKKGEDWEAESGKEVGESRGRVIMIGETQHQK